jgi:NitT/TauT family transport system substrate-binding protein
MSWCEPMQQRLFNYFLLITTFVIMSAWDGQAQGLKKIRWGATSIGASQWIPWIAKDAKLYEKNGLDVEIILLRGSGQTSQAMIGGSIFASPVTTATLMTANLSGADLATVAHTVSAVQGKLVTKPEIRKPEDLKGKKVASSGLGSLGDFMYRVAMRKYGLNPDKDVIWLTVGNPPERLQALISGVVDAADLSYPYDAEGERRGFRALWDARQEVPYPSMSVVTRRKTIQEDRDGVMRMLKAHVEGIHFLKTQKEASQKILAKYLRTNDKEFLEGSYEIYSKDFIATPYPIVNGLQVAYDQVAQRRPDIYQHKAEEFVDPSFITELDKSGFIKKLYGQK